MKLVCDLNVGFRCRRIPLPSGHSGRNVGRRFIVEIVDAPHVVVSFPAARIAIFHYRVAVIAWIHFHQYGFLHISRPSVRVHLVFLCQSNRIVNMSHTGVVGCQNEFLAFLIVGNAAFKPFVEVGYEAYGCPDACLGVVELDEIPI